jgi:hypothetical protein
MRTRTCDICKKTIEKEKLEIAVYGKGLIGYENFDLCPKYAEPVMKFLKKHKLGGIKSVPVKHLAGLK